MNKLTEGEIENFVWEKTEQICSKCLWSSVCKHTGIGCEAIEVLWDIYSKEKNV